MSNDVWYVGTAQAHDNGDCEFYFAEIDYQHFESNLNRLTMIDSHLGILKWRWTHFDWMINETSALDWIKIRIANVPFEWNTQLNRNAKYVPDMMTFDDLMPITVKHFCRKYYFQWNLLVCPIRNERNEFRFRWHDSFFFSFLNGRKKLIFYH